MRADYWITPVRSDDEWDSETVIRNYVEHDRIFAFGNKALMRLRVKAGDFICFYVGRRGVVAHAKVITTPEKRSNSPIRDPEMYPWVFDLSNVAVYWKDPIVINAKLRSSLDAFKNKDLGKSWAWFVQTTRRISKHDFAKLTTKR